MAIGDPNLYFSRDTKVYLVQGANIWEIPVLNGFTFTQSTNTSEIMLAEMSDAAGTSRRGRQMFNDSLAPAEWSFDTYVRPFNNGTSIRAVEEALWANFIANNTFTSTTPAWAAGVTFGAAALDFDFSASNKTTLGTFDLIFVLGAGKAATANYAASEVTTIYRVQNASINEVAVTFDIDGISTLGWSGMGATLREITSFDATAALRGGVDATNNFIRNRLTQLTMTSSVTGSAKTYLVTLTGGTITFTNNMTYLTPEVLGKVNVPLGHVTGARSIGGKAAGDAPIAPGMQFKIPAAHLTIPAIDTGDVVSVSVDFAALPSTIDQTNEVSVVRYAGIAP